MQNNSLLRRRSLLAGLAVLATPHPGRAAGVLRVATLKATNDLALAKAHGSLERALAAIGTGIEWSGPFAAAAPAAEALAAGAVDLTVGSSTSFVTSRAAGVKLVMFAAQRLSPAGEAIVVQGSSRARSITDLAGGGVAVNRGGTGEYLLVRAMARAGMAPDSVKRIYLGPADARAAFAAGAVEGWAIWDPFLSMAVQAGAKVLADGAQCGSENAVAYFVSPGVLAANRPAVETVLRVLRQENAWAAAHANEAGALWARELGLPASLGPRLGRNNTPPIGPVGAEQAAQVEHIADWYVENRIVPARPDIAGFLVDLSAAS